MTSSINASTAAGGGVITTADASGILALQTAGTTAITIDGSQNVGIGTSSPQAKFDVSSLSRWRVDLSGTTAIAYVTNSAINAYYDWRLDALSHQFYTNGSEKMRIDSSGNVGVGVVPSYGKLDVNGDSAIRASNRQLFYNATNGNYAYIKNTATGTGNVLTLGTNADAVNIDSSGNLCVGTATMQSNPGGAGVNAIFNSGIVVGGGGGGVRSAWTSDRINFSTTNFYVLNGSNTGVVLPNGNTSWGSQSDERTKDIIEPITNAAEKVSTLRAVIGKYKTDEDSKRRSFLIAQDVQAVLPEAVTALDDEQNTLVLAYTETIPLLVAAIQEQQALITSLTERIAALETK